MSDRGRRVARSIRAALVIAALARTAGAHAKLPPQAPAPDPSRGETYDGRVRVRETTGRKLALLAPRTVLAVPRLALWIIRIPVLLALDHTDRRDGAERTAPAAARPGWRLSPIVSLRRGFDPALGAKLVVRDFGGPGVAEASLALETSGPTYVKGEIAIVPNPALTLGVGLELGAYRRADEPFYGLAGEVPWGVDGDDLLRRVEVRSIEAALELVLRPRGAAGEWRGRLRPSVAARDFEPGRDGTPVDLAEPGLREATTFVHAEVGLDRIGPFDVSRGLSGLDTSCSLAHGRGIAGDGARWLTATASAAYGIPVGSGRAVVISGLVADQHAWGRDPIAFTERLSLGGGRYHRGFPSGRFRGGSAILAAFDYRFPLFMGIDGFAFLEHGGAFGEHFDGFAPWRLRTSIGVGMRLFWGPSTVRVTVGWGVGDGANFALSFDGGL